MAKDLTARFRARLDLVLAHLRTAFAPDDPFVPEDDSNTIWLLCEPGDEAAAKKRYLTELSREDRLPWTAQGKMDHPLAYAVAVSMLYHRPDIRPRTVADAIAIIEADEHLIPGTILELEQCVELLVEDELRAAVLARGTLTDRWPWAPSVGGTVMAVLIAQKEPSNGGGLQRDHWPGEAAPADAARWAQDAINNLFSEDDEMPPHVRLGDDLVKMAESGTMNRGLGELCASIVMPDDWPGPWISVRGVGLLYLAERAVKYGIPSTPSMGLVSVESTSVQSFTALAGANPIDVGKGDVWKDDNPAKLCFEWHDGTQLVLNFTPGANPLVAVAERYGVDAVRDLLGLYLFTWAAGAPAGDALWWWPDEHLALIDKKNSPDNRSRLRTWLTHMRHTSLRVDYRDGGYLEGPLVEGEMTDGVARRLFLHPSLYRGVTQPSGRPGNYWWPVSIELLRLPADKTAGKVHVLAPVLGRMWRAELRKTGDRETPPCAHITLERLADMLAIARRTDRYRDKRAADTMRKTLEAAVEGKLVGKWQVDGSLDHLTGTLKAWPGAGAMEVRQTGPTKAAWLPATGGDVAAWLRRMGLTSDAAGDVLATSGSTLRRVCSTHRNRPLPPRVRAAFRRHLWPDLDE